MTILAVFCLIRFSSNSNKVGDDHDSEQGKNAFAISTAVVMICQTRWLRL